MKYIYEKYNFYFYILIYIIFSFYFSLFYIKNGLTLGKDGGFFYILDLNTLFSKFSYIWETNIHGFPSFFNIIAFPFYFFISSISSINIKISVFVYWFFVFFTSFLGSFLLTKKIIEIFNLLDNKDYINRNYIAFFSSLIFIFSPIAVIYRWGDTNSQVFSYATINLLLYIIISFILEKNEIKIIRYAIFITIILTLLSFSFINITLIANIIIFILIILIFKGKIYKIKIKVLNILFIFGSILWIIITIKVTSLSIISLRTQYLTIDSMRKWLDFYEKTLTDFSPLLFYPTKLWNGLFSYDNYYINSLVILLWSFFILILYTITFMSLKNKKHKQFVYFTLTIMIISTSLVLIPKGPLGYIYNILLEKITLLWAFRNAFDKFNYILQISLLLITINSLTFLHKNKYKYKIFIILYTIVLSIIALPLLTGLSAYDYSGISSKTIIPKEFLDIKYKLTQISRTSDSWFLWIPFAKGSWIKGYWYYGLDYTIYLPGKHSGAFMDLSNITKKIATLLSSDDFIINNTKQEELIKYLILGNYKYIIFRNDINLTKQELISVHEQNVRNQLLNIFYFIDKYNLTKIYSIGNTKKCNALFLSGNNSYAIVLNTSDIDTAFIYGQIIFRKLSLNYDKGWNIIFDKNYSFGMANPGGKALKFTIYSNGRFYDLQKGNVINNLNWLNVSFLYKNKEMMLYKDSILLGKKNVEGQPSKNNNNIWIGWNPIKVPGEEFYGLISSMVLYDEPNLDKPTLYLNFSENKFTHPIKLYNSLIVTADCPFTNSSVGYEIYINPYAKGNIFIITEDNEFKSIEYNMINPTKYILTLDNKKPIMLILSETYNPFWIAKIYKDGRLLKEIEPVSYMNSVNMFYVDVIGKSNVVIEFTPQSLFYKGIVLSLFTFFSHIIYYIIHKNRLIHR